MMTAGPWYACIMLRPLVPARRRRSCDPTIIANFGDSEIP